MKHETISNITTDLTARDPAPGVALNKSKGRGLFILKSNFILLCIFALIYICACGGGC